MKNIFHINKPINMSSNAAIQHIKKRTNIKKIGHGGTLDPLATGVLIIGINSGTKLLNNSLIDNKQYEVEIEFGYETTTLDSEGELVNQTTNIPNIDDINRVLASGYFREYNQTVPLYSAVKVNGMELYKYARAGKEIETPSKLVKLIDYKVISYRNNLLKILIDVSKGFFVRSFARDLAHKLDSYATITGLKRTKSGAFDIENAFEIDEFIEFYNSNISNNTNKY